MEIMLTRTHFTTASTVGEMYVDCIKYCETLEPVTKSTGKPRAIPKGRYLVTVAYSNTFKRELPILISVPDFVGIRIHRGNKPADTKGCILPGDYDPEFPDWVSSSTKYEIELTKLIKECDARGEKVFITIK